MPKLQRRMATFVQELRTCEKDGDVMTPGELIAFWCWAGPAIATTIYGTYWGCKNKRLIKPDDTGFVVAVSPLVSAIAGAAWPLTVPAFIGSLVGNAEWEKDQSEVDELRAEVDRLTCELLTMKALPRDGVYR